MKTNSKDSFQVPPKFAIKFANKVFVLGILFSVLVAVYAVYKILNPTDPTTSLSYITSTYYYSFLLFTLLTASFFGIGLRKLRDVLKVNLSVMLITVGISVCGFETYLEFFYTDRVDVERLRDLKRERLQGATLREEQQSPKSIANKWPFDTRMGLEVIDDLIDSGINAYPNVYPQLFIKSNGLKTSKENIFPIGGISNITTILGFESGYYPIIETDEHGFNNPKGLYQPNKVDIVLTGDSFTEGYSVHSDETISSVLLH
jgi:hypothetical protein